MRDNHTSTSNDVPSEDDDDDDDLEREADELYQWSQQFSIESMMTQFLSLMDNNNNYCNLYNLNFYTITV